MTSGAVPSSFHLDRFADYLTLERGAADRTHEAYERDLTRFALFANAKGAREPAAATPRLLREYIYHLKDLGLAPASIRRGNSRRFFAFRVPRGAGQAAK